MPSSLKTDPAEARRIERLHTMSPMMAALTGNVDQWHTVRTSDAMWRDLARADALDRVSRIARRNGGRS